MSRRYPERPIVGVGAVVLAQDKVLLIKRGAEPSKGLWSIPGGAVETGERLRQACAREVLEETGLKVRVGPLVEVVQRIAKDGRSRVEYHYVLMDYLCTTKMAEPTAGDDADDARWVRLDELAELGVTPDTVQVIHMAVAMLEPGGGN